MGTSVPSASPRPWRLIAESTHVPSIMQGEVPSVLSLSQLKVGRTGNGGWDHKLQFIIIYNNTEFISTVTTVTITFY